MKLAPPKLFAAARPRGGRREVVGDALAGITLASMNIPQLLGYARIAGMPLVAGLYTALLAPIGFAMLGSSRHLVVAADSGTAAILAGALSQMAEPGSTHYMSLAATTALLTGVMLLLARVFRLGFLADFLSRTVLVGFLSGVGIQVAIAMLGDMLGVAVRARSTVLQLWQIAGGLSRSNALTLIISALGVAAILSGRRVAPKIPVSLVLVVVAIGASRALHLAGRGVAMLGIVVGGLPSFGLSLSSWNEALKLLPVAASCFVVIIAQSAATARAMAMRYEEATDEDADLLGLAVANGAAAISGAFVVNGSPTQSAMAERAGARSQLSQIVFAACVILVLLLLTGPLQYLPRCVLGAIVFTIAIGMIDVATLRAMRIESPGEFKLAVATAAAVALIGVEQGVLLAIGLSLLRHVRQSYRPHTAVLQFDAAQGWLTVPATPGHQTAPGLILYRFGADLFYANAPRFAAEAHALVDGAPSSVRWLVIEADAITNLDYTAARVVLSLIHDLARHKVGIAFARVSASLRADMDRHGVTAIVGQEKIFFTRHAALAAVDGPVPVGDMPQ
ncbi:MAG TPA: SulP family inorganic anion transporter [Steroidobacteraceae bacterium]|jgi:high affinity sulfate transporter 1|nr:SulP family inorganic anion transporter [Steroidobacteraceae bacterium]